MQFESKKVENCFSDAENYEYLIEIPGSDFVEMLRLESSNNLKSDSSSAPERDEGAVVEYSRQAHHDSAAFDALNRDYPVARTLRINDSLRRPTFIAVLTNGIQLKGLMDKNVIKVGYVPDCSIKQKADFERWLSGL